MVYGVYESSRSIGRFTRERGLPLRKSLAKVRRDDRLSIAGERQKLVERAPNEENSQIVGTISPWTALHG
jgi:hypothetical protein